MYNFFISLNNRQAVSFISKLNLFINLEPSWYNLSHRPRYCNLKSKYKLKLIHVSSLARSKWM